MHIDNYDFIWKTRRLFKLMAMRSDLYLEPMELSAAERALMECLYKWGAQTVPDLARLFHVSRQNIQIRANTLLKKGYIAKVDNQAHKKSHLLSLTESGQQTFRKILATEVAIMSDLFKDVEQKEVKAGNKTLSLLINRLCERMDLEEPPIVA